MTLLALETRKEGERIRKTEYSEGAEGQEDVKEERASGQDDQTVVIWRWDLGSDPGFVHEEVVLPLDS